MAPTADAAGRNWVAAGAAVLARAGAKGSASMARRGCLRRRHDLGPGALAQRPFGVRGRAPRSGGSFADPLSSRDFPCHRSRARSGGYPDHTGRPLRRAAERPQRGSHRRRGTELTLLIPDITPLADPGSLRAALISTAQPSGRWCRSAARWSFPETPTSPAQPPPRWTRWPTGCRGSPPRLIGFQAQRNRLAETAPDPASAPPRSSTKSAPAWLMPWH